MDNNLREDNLLFSEGGSRIIFSIKNEEESNWLNFLNEETKNFTNTIYVKKIGYVASDYLNIKVEDKLLCNIGVDQLAEKFNNSISNQF